MECISLWLSWTVRVVLYDDSRRPTLIHEKRIFDILVLSDRVLSLTHLVTYPTVAPEAVEGTMFIVVAIREDTDMHGCELPSLGFLK